MRKALLFVGILLLSLLLAWKLVRRTTRAGDSPRVTQVGHSSAPASHSSTLEPGPGEAVWSGTSAAPDEGDLSVAACAEGMVFVAANECQGADKFCIATAPFCIDRYEYPNLPGVLPAAMVRFDEARRGCSAEGKRLCSDAEWTWACSGQGPAPAASTCNLGPELDEQQLDLLEASPRDVAGLLARIDRRTESGAMAECVSSTGAADLLGNVQEWVQTSHPGYEAGQKGGHFATAQASCEAGKNVKFHLIRRPYNGFRCCSDALIPVGAPGP